MIFLLHASVMLFMLHHTQSHTQRREVRPPLRCCSCFLVYTVFQQGCIHRDMVYKKKKKRHPQKSSWRKKVQNLHRQYNKARNLTGFGNSLVWLFSCVMATAAAVLVGGRHRHLPQWKELENNIAANAIHTLRLRHDACVSPHSTCVVIVYIETATLPEVAAATSPGERLTIRDNVFREIQRSGTKAEY